MANKGTKFASITDKLKLRIAIESGDLTALVKVFDEIERLEGIVKDYEICIGGLIARQKISESKPPKL